MQMHVQMHTNAYKYVQIRFDKWDMCPGSYNENPEEEEEEVEEKEDDWEEEEGK